MAHQSGVQGEGAILCLHSNLCELPLVESLGTIIYLTVDPIHGSRSCPQACKQLFNLYFDFVFVFVSGLHLAPAHGAITQCVRS